MFSLIEYLSIIDFLLITHSVCIFTSVGCVLSYGEDCRYPCSVHCVNQTCNRFNGRCVFGCHDGFSGDQCYQGIFHNLIVNESITNNHFAFNLINDSFLPLADMKTKISNCLLVICSFCFKCIF